MQEKRFIFDISSRQCGMWICWRPELCNSIVTDSTLNDAKDSLYFSSGNDYNVLKQNRQVLSTTVDFILRGNQRLKFFVTVSGLFIDSNKHAFCMETGPQSMEISYFSAPEALFHELQPEIVFCDSFSFMAKHQ